METHAFGTAADCTGALDIGAVGVGWTVETAEQPTVLRDTPAALNRCPTVSSRRPNWKRYDVPGKDPMTGEQHM